MRPTPAILISCLPFILRHQFVPILSLSVKDSFRPYLTFESSSLLSDFRTRHEGWTSDHIRILSICFENSHLYSGNWVWYKSVIFLLSLWVWVYIIITRRIWVWRGDGCCCSFLHLTHCLLPSLEFWQADLATLQLQVKHGIESVAEGPFYLLLLAIN